MNAAQDLDRNEAATPYKLEQARQRGEMGKSADLVGLLVIVTALTWLAGRGEADLLVLFRFDRDVLLTGARGMLDAATLLHLSLRVLQAGLALLAPFFAALMLAAVLGNVLQNRPVFSLEPLTPDWGRLNPARGLQRLFSLRTAYDAVRAGLKCAALTAALWFALRTLPAEFGRLSGLAAAGFMKTLLEHLAALGWRVAIVLLLLALLDLVFTRREFASRMRMSRRELHDEICQREGDPRIRARLRQLRLKFHERSRSIGRTGEGDVLITNPTHLAVALRYRHGEMAAPLIVAKGAGVLAAAMRVMAARHRIPVVRSPALARVLYRQLDPGQSLPPDLYAGVARILVWVMAMRKTAQTEAST